MVRMAICNFISKAGLKTRSPACGEFCFQGEIVRGLTGEELFGQVKVQQQGSRSDYDQEY